MLSPKIELIEPPSSVLVPSFDISVPVVNSLALNTPGLAAWKGVHEASSLGSAGRLGESGAAWATGIQLNFTYAPPVDWQDGAILYKGNYERVKTFFCNTAEHKSWRELV
jgi:hypothetical protein